jgi:hypothetical protein
MDKAPAIGKAASMTGKASLTASGKNHYKRQKMSFNSLNSTKFNALRATPPMGELRRIPNFVIAVQQS